MIGNDGRIYLRYILFFSVFREETEHEKYIFTKYDKIPIFR